MSEYTPSIEEVREDYVAANTRHYDAYLTGIPLATAQEVFRGDFDRMIERVRREAAADALEQAAAAYRDGQITGIFYGRNDYTKAWLNARAAAIREAGDLNG